MGHWSVRVDAAQLKGPGLAAMWCGVRCMSWKVCTEYSGGVDHGPVMCIPCGRGLGKVAL